MINIPEPFKGTENFWELNSQYKMLFDEFYSKDRSKGKSKSSTIMWAFTFKLHPDSIFYHIPNKEDIIKEKILKDSKFKWSKYEDEEVLFKSSILTQAERSLVEWNDFMMKRDKYLKNTDYYFDEYQTDDNGDNVLSKTGKPILLRGTAEQLDKALGTTPKMFSDFAKITKELKEDKMKKGKANKPLSPSDANEI